MADEFAVGDVVKLKSGGPAMTVTEVGNDMYDQAKVWCAWFTEKGDEKKGSYPPGSLEKW